MRQTYRFRVPCSICQHTLGFGIIAIIDHNLRITQESGPVGDCHVQ